MTCSGAASERPWVNTDGRAAASRCVPSALHEATGAAAWPGTEPIWGFNNVVAGQRRHDALAGLGVHADVSSPPGPVRPGAMPLAQPSAGAAGHRAGTAGQQMDGLRPPRTTVAPPASGCDGEGQEPLNPSVWRSPEETRPEASASLGSPQESTRAGCPGWRMALRANPSDAASGTTSPSFSTGVALVPAHHLPPPLGDGVAAVMMQLARHDGRPGSRTAPILPCRPGPQRHGPGSCNGVWDRPCRQPQTLPASATYTPASPKPAMSARPSPFTSASSRG